VKSHERPRPRALIGIDPDNAYARLGVSPTTSTEEIKTFVDTRIAEIKASMRDRSSREQEDALARLTEVGKQIGTARARAKYHETNPWNELLAVQRTSADETLDPGARTNLVTAALLTELGHDALLPTARSFAVWAPAGIPAALAAELQAFIRDPAGESAPRAHTAADEAQLSINELHDRDEI